MRYTACMHVYYVQKLTLWVKINAFELLGMTKSYSRTLISPNCVYVLSHYGITV